MQDRDKINVSIITHDNQYGGRAAHMSPQSYSKNCPGGFLKKAGNAADSREPGWLLKARMVA